MKSKFTPVACLAALALASCSGMRSAEGQCTVHAESFRIFGFAIPHDDQAKAAQMAKEHLASQDTSMSTPADWTSFCGILGNIIGFHGTSISGKAK